MPDRSPSSRGNASSSFSPVFMLLLLLSCLVAMLYLHCISIHGTLMNVAIYPCSIYVFWVVMQAVVSSHCTYLRHILVAHEAGAAGPRSCRPWKCRRHHIPPGPAGLSFVLPSSCTIWMSSYLTFEEENAAWATPEPGGTGDIIKDAMMKEKLIKCVHCALWVITSLLTVVA